MMRAPALNRTWQFGHRHKTLVDIGTLVGTSKCLDVGVFGVAAVADSEAYVACLGGVVVEVLHVVSYHGRPYEPLCRCGTSGGGVVAIWSTRGLASGGRFSGLSTVVSSCVSR
ncbi:hypothetical protein DFQ14_106164 [Halopolyspora algeriensis]|uniref:Uncharacterized protein n=1 Tax=Halopolyspora algeriensis TaxID=1500506 RepID=A0A368VUN8_9ACTN|nr:hypothetical protein DFQ14_106164 [Halopolyspora algeriensis]